MLIADGQVHTARRFALAAVDSCQLRGEWPLAADGDRRWAGTPALELAALAGTLRQVGEGERAVAAAEAALQDVLGIGSETQRQFLLAEVAGRLAEGDLTELALQAVAGVAGDSGRRAPLRAVVLRLAASGRHAAARDACDLLQSDWHRLPLLVELASALPPVDPVLAEVTAAVLSRLDSLPAGWTAGPLLAHCLPVADATGGSAAKSDLAARAINAARNAGDTAEEVHDKVAAIWSLAGVIRGLASAGCPAETASLLADLREQAAGLDDTLPGTSANLALVTALEQVALTAIADGDLPMAVDLATEAEALLPAPLAGGVPTTFEVPGFSAPTWETDGPLLSVLRSAARRDLRFAVEQARRITADWLRDQALTAIAMVAVSDRSWPFVWELIDLIPTTPRRLAVLSAASEALVFMGQGTAREVARRVTQLKLSSRQRWDRSWVRADLAASLAGAGLLDDAVAIVSGTAADDVRTWGCVVLLRNLPPGERGDLVPHLAQLAVDAAAAASGSFNPRAMGVMNRMIVPGDNGELRVSVREPRNIIGQLTRRGLTGFPGTGFTLALQGDVRTMVLPEIVKLLIKHDRADIARPIVAAAHARVPAASSPSHREWQLVQIGGCLSLLGDADGALTVAAEMSYQEPTLRLLTLIGQTALDQGDHPTAEFALNEAASRLDDLPRGPQRAGILSSYAMLAGRAGRLDLAISGGMRDLAGSLLMQDSAFPGMVQVIMRSGTTEHLADLMAAAEDLHSNDPARFLDIAEAHALCGSPDEQRRCLLRAQRLMLTGDNAQSTAAALLKVAARHRSRGLADDAVSAALDALTEASRVTDPYLRDELLSRVAWEFIDLGAFDRARACARLFRAPSLAASVLQRLCAVQYATNPELTRELAMEAAQVAADTTDMDQAARCWSSAMLAYAMAGEASSARICLANACAMARTLGTEKFLRTIGSAFPFFRVLEADPNPLLGLDRAFAEIGSWR